jgi:DNA adenine methylase
MADEIVKTFPPHKIYVEPFGGSGAVLFAKPPSIIEVYNDVDNELVNLFMVLRDKELSAELEQQFELTCYARSEFALAKTPSGNPVERARRLMVRQRQSFGMMSLAICRTLSVAGERVLIVFPWRSSDCLASRLSARAGKN